MVLVPETKKVAGVLVGFGFVRGGVAQRHVCIPPSQAENAELIGRYVVRIHLQLARFGVDPKDVIWGVVEERDLNEGVSGTGYKVKFEVLSELERATNEWR